MKDKALRVSKITGLVSLLAASMLFFNWDAVTLHIVEGTVCLVLFISFGIESINRWIEWIDGQPSKPNYRVGPPPPR